MDISDWSRKWGENASRQIGLPEHFVKHIDDMRSGKREFSDDVLDCSQSYSVYKFHPELGQFSACCDASLLEYDHELFTSTGIEYFDLHPELVDRKKSLRENKKHSHCVNCWKKESQGLTSMRQGLALTDFTKTHQNPYLDMKKSYVNRIELWMNSTCNLGCLMCNLGNSNTLRKIWYTDYDQYGNDGRGFDQFIADREYSKKEMHDEFVNRIKDWTKAQISDSSQDNLTIAYLGGEPTLHSEMYEHTDEFIEAGKHAIKNGKKLVISITTNGTSKDKLNERFYNMFRKYKSNGWVVRIVLSQDGTDEAANVRPGVNQEQVMNNFHNWINPNSVINDVSNFTVLSNLNFPYVHKLAEKLKNSIDTHYSDDPKKLFISRKQIELSFNACISPTWMQMKYLPKKYAMQSANRSLEIYKYLASNYNVFVRYEVFDSIVENLQETPDIEDVKWYFEQLHDVQRVHRKFYGPKTDFYKFFPHLVEFAKEYGIERQ